MIGFQKTSLLEPGESETVEVTAEAKNFASYDQEKSAWIIDAGLYGIFVSENAESSKLAWVLKVESDCIFEKVSHIVKGDPELKEIEAPQAIAVSFTKEWTLKAEEANMLTVVFKPSEEKTIRRSESEHAKAAMEIAEKMTDAELTAMLMGEISKGQDNMKNDELVESGIFVPGAAGETSCKFEEKYGIPAISMADGPAGLRLMRKYDVDNETGLIYGHGILEALEGGFLQKNMTENM